MKKRYVIHFEFLIALNVQKNFFLLILNYTNIFINLGNILTNFTLQTFLIAYVFQKPLLSLIYMDLIINLLLFYVLNTLSLERLF